jgi:hypothetical protein
MAENTANLEDKSKVYIIHKLMAVILDILVVVIFVAMGSREHDLDYTFGYALLTALPFIASFFVVQAVVASDLRSIKSAVISSVISVPLAIAIRINLPQLAGREEYEFKPVFAVIALLFLTFAWVAWRFLLAKLRPTTSK